MLHPDKFLLILFMMLPSFIWAQQNEPVEKFTPPVVTVTLGEKSDSSVVSQEEGDKLVAMALTIKDSAGAEYKIESYQFLYKKLSYMEDNETGKIIPVYSTVGQRFYATPLPPVWIKNIGPYLKQTEELSFFDIIAKDKKGRPFYAPSLKIIIGQ